jgi:hypothetical protein
MVPTPNLVHIIVNPYSLPFVIRECVCKQPISVTMEIRGEPHRLDQGKLIKTCGEEGTRVHYREGTSITGGVNLLLMKVEVLGRLEALGHSALPMMVVL